MYGLLISIYVATAVCKMGSTNLLKHLVEPVRSGERDSLNDTNQAGQRDTVNDTNRTGQWVTMNDTNQTGQRETMNDTNQAGQRDTMNDTNQAGQRDTMNDTNRTGQWVTMNDTNQTGQRETMNETNQAGQRDTMNDTNHTGQRDTMNDTNQTGQRDTMNDTNQTGQRDTMNDTNQTGQWDTMNDTNQTGQRDTMNDTNQAGQRDTLNDTNQIGQRDTMNDTNQAGQRDTMNDTNQTGQRDTMNDTNQTGQRDTMNDTNQTGQWGTMNDTDQAVQQGTINQSRKFIRYSSNGEQYTVQGMQTCPRHSCMENCGNKTEFRYGRPCSCSEKCTIYGNCCRDFLKLCSSVKGEEQTVEISQSPALKCVGGSCYTCVESKYYFPSFLVTRCAYRANNSVKKKCEQPTDKISEHIPVLYNKTGDMFRNIYCAICHQVPVTELEAMQPKFSCERGQISKAFQQSSLSTLTFEEVTALKCRIQGLPNAAWAGLESCMQYDISGCPEEKRCGGETEPVSVTSNGKVLLLKNQFCQRCFSASTTFSDFTCWGYRAVALPFQPFSPMDSFSVLFDLSRFEKYEISLFTDADPLLPTEPMVLSPSYKVKLSFAGIDNEQTSLNRLTGHLTRMGFSINSLNTEAEKSCILPKEYKHDCIHITLEQPCCERPFVALKAVAHALISENITLFSAFVSNTQTGLESACLSSRKTFSLSHVFLEKGMLEYGQLVSEIPSINRSLPPFEIQVMTGHEGRSFSYDTLVLLNVSMCATDVQDDCQTDSNSFSSFANITGENIFADLGLETLSGVNQTFCREDVRDVGPMDEGSTAQKRLKQLEIFISVIGNSFSLLALCLSIAVRIFRTNGKSLSSRCTTNFLCAMLQAEAVYLAACAVKWKIQLVCQSLAILQHLSWLCVFSWTSVMSLDLCRMVVGGKPPASLAVSGNRSRFWFYYLWSWIPPIVIVTVCVSLDVSEVAVVGYGRNMVCWIGDKNALLFAFILPVGFYLCINMGAFGLIAWSIHRTEILVRKMKVKFMQSDRQRLVIYLKLFTLLGFTWILGILANIFPHPILWFVFSAVNSVQGLIMFFTLKCCNEVFNVLKGWKNKFLRSSNTDNNSTSDQLNGNNLALVWCPRAQPNSLVIRQKI